MQIVEKEIKIPYSRDAAGLIGHFKKEVESKVPSGEIPIRFVVTESTRGGFKCEIGTLACEGDQDWTQVSSIFDFKKRPFENTREFNVVLLVPTGIGAEIGGHAGDAGPLARLMASVCDNLITHPNVVNASDINELPDNGLYVEGSLITRLLMGEISLKKVRSNRVLLVMEKHPCGPYFEDKSINAFNAARATLGMEGTQIIRLDEALDMRALWSNAGRAVGRIDHFDRLAAVIDREEGKFDALALATRIQVPMEFHTEYYNEEIDMVNPWGGVEAMLTHTVSTLYNIPSAHAPMMTDQSTMNLDLGVVDPRKSAEIISEAFLHCVLKGLHRSPQVITDPLLINHPDFISASNVSALVIPDGCMGLPTLAALSQEIPVIVVKGNKNQARVKLEPFFSKARHFYTVENYFEAAGLLMSLRAGVSVESLQRPLKKSLVVSSLDPAMVSSQSNGSGR
ncbi:MAG: high light inducible protein [Candidatus Omnitrophica bacterium CG11_big_fil_rev_8_21_14_0_20_64_10]|nr:MAG: high light inducible protein [Candidatus Omnitrophica bacterium CG11_big_fil_rev_8_21_14_0_20_64_10]